MERIFQWTEEIYPSLWTCVRNMYTGQYNVICQVEDESILNQIYVQSNCQITYTHVLVAQSYMQTGHKEFRHSHWRKNWHKWVTIKGVLSTSTKMAANTVTSIVGKTNKTKVTRTSFITPISCHGKTNCEGDKKAYINLNLKAMEDEI